MYAVQKINNDLTYVGYSDRRLHLFENIFPIPEGVSYNAYVLTDEKNVLLDTVDRSVAPYFFENLAHVLGKKKLDYIVVNHMEPDHCATLAETADKYPEAKIVCNAKTAEMIKQFFNRDFSDRFVLVKEGDTLKTGKHTLAFVMAPMVHWPEVMVTYDTTDKTLFSADAFGSFGALGGNIFADEINFERDRLDEARRYYTNIVGKYGAAVQTLLKKAASLDIQTICPLHGHIWRKNLSWFIEKYQLWSTYTPENKAVMIAYASIYGNTENAATVLANKLAEKGVKNIVMYDVSSTHPSVIVSESFRCSHLVFAAPTYNGGLFPPMETVLSDLKAHTLQNRTVALIENGTWAAASGRLMREAFTSMKKMTVLEETASLKSALSDGQEAALNALACTLAKSL